MIRSPKLLTRPGSAPCTT